MLRAAVAVLGATAITSVAAQADAEADCRGSVYLTFDTGNMRHAELIAATLRKHGVKATFFLANERTPRGDFSLDPAWADFWRTLAAEGHAFGSHTWRHGRLLGDLPAGAVRYKPQFGEAAGRELTLTSAQMCDELRRVGTAFEAMTGRALDPLWRAPGGRITPNALAAAQTCGFSHVHWAPAGFLGDELPSDTYPNDQLLQRAVRDIRAGDVLMAHLGIWSRAEPFAPMIDPLIAGLKARGLCLRTLREHPQFQPAAAAAPRELAAQLARR
ncbi:MAG: polysaccharide deacetylase family protein [Burkholderiaceae bacterium]|nr:polysaccharide deacetylase family protein [Burkholderiaceae bacterium]